MRVGEVAGAAAEVAALVADGLPPRRQDLDDLVEVAAQRCDDGRELGVGDRLDVLTEVPAVVAEGVAVEQAAAAEPFQRAVELLGAPGPGADVRPERQPPEQLGEQPDLDRVEAGRHPGDGVGVAPVLAQLVAEPPDPSDRVVGEPEGADARVQRSPLDREVVDGPGEQLVGPGQAGRVVAQDAAELTDRARVAGGADGRRVGERPPVGHGGHHDRGVEDGERRRHQLARHLAHDRPAAGEVGGAVGERHLAGLAGAGAEAQRDIGGMALGREVHLPDHGLQGRSEAAGRCDGATVGYRHGSGP